MKLKFLFTGCFVVWFVVGGFSQSMEYVSQGDKLYKQGDYKGALPLYFRALHDSRENPEVLFKIGMAYLYSETKSQAVTFLEKAYKNNPEVDPDILFYMAMAYQSNHEYAKAKYLYEHHKKRIPKKKHAEIDKKISQCMVSHSLVNNRLPIVIENIGSTINSKYDDYAPTVSTDGNTMFFTSKRSSDPSGLVSGDEDIYTSSKINGDWSEPKKVVNITRGHHDAVSSLSYDGKSLFLYYDDNNGDLYVSKMLDGQWGFPKPLGPNINTPFRETHCSVSKDGKRLFFSSSRPGGIGGLDIYMSELKEDGDWGRAINLGSLVNTSGDEDAPYIHPDGKTLYFASNGHPGMGNADIFKTEFEGGRWSKPENMGYPLNSIEYDGFFTISEDKRVAYFATRRKYGVGEFDILRATYVNVRPKPVEMQPVASKPAPTAAKKKSATAPTMVMIYGKAFDKKTNSPLAVNISLSKAQSDSELAYIRSMPDGTYELMITEPGEYVITAENDDYLFNEVNISIPKFKDPQVETNFAMSKIESGSTFILKNLLFDSGKADLKSSSILELEKVRRLMLANPELRLSINGHTDNVGDPAANKKLSLRRALAVVNYLALNGIDFERLSAKGYGDEKPIASNDDEIGGRELNRRTEVEVLEPRKEL